MLDMPHTHSHEATFPITAPVARPAHKPRQIVLVFQGGGALGAYQAGVYQALHEAGVEPDWIIGTSIGAINASLIAGNEPGTRLERLEEFWRRMRHRQFSPLAAWPGVAESMGYWSMLLGGIPGFFEPNPAAFFGAQYPLGRDKAGFYSTAPLHETLTELVDFALLKQCKPRLTVGAAHVRTSQMRYFDSRESAITAQHIVASGALPPAFPAVRIEGELYWDGGILSNTPTEAIFEDFPRRDSLIFAVHTWNPTGPEPNTIWEVLHRQKDIQYSSRVASHISRQRQVHKLRHVVSELLKFIPESERRRAGVQELAEYGCRTQMHVVRLLAPRLDNENHTKDVDFSAGGIGLRWQAGHADTSRALKGAAWEEECDPLEGVILHDVIGEVV
ncbi:MAG: patatin-like phospholipase family protein [Xanthobacteraceae bacterium]